MGRRNYLRDTEARRAERDLQGVPAMHKVYAGLGVPGWRINTKGTP